MNRLKELYLRGYEGFYDQLVGEGVSPSEARAVAWTTMLQNAERILAVAEDELEDERKRRESPDEDHGPRVVGIFSVSGAGGEGP